MANITTLDLGVITPIPKGEYNSVTDYERLNFVTFNGSSWIRTEKEPYVVGSIPQTGSLYWQLNALGVSEIPDASLTVKGITKLSNATNSVDETVAATSRAVKSAYDIGSTAVSNATTANNTANSALSIANSTKAITDLVSLTAIAGGIPKADSTGKISDKWINIPAGKSLGEVFIYTGTDVPAGSLPCDGTQYTRFNITYSDAYAWVTTKAKTKTLTEYTAIVNQYGECGFWGLDTATGTVRVPMIKSFIQGTTSVDDISKSVKAGLPNITGSLNSSNGDVQGYYRDPKGAFQTLNGNRGAFDAREISSGFYNGLSFDASRSNTIYGNSTTVQPQAIKYRWFVQVYSSVLPASTADMANWNTQLDGRANTSLTNVSSNIRFVVYAWASSDKSSWYRKYNDGWVEQGGKDNVSEYGSRTIILNTPMQTTAYTALVSNSSGKMTNDAEGVMTVGTRTRTSIAITAGMLSPNTSPFDWYVCGY